MSGSIDPCPNDEVLAQFASGSLPGADRRSIAYHVAACPECLRVVAETTQFLAPSRESDEHRRPLAGWMSMAAAAFICVGVFLWGAVHRDPLGRLKSIVDRSRGRPIEASLYGFPWKSYSRARSGLNAALDSSLQFEAERVASRAATDARGFHARGVGALLAGDTPGAISDLIEATRRLPGSAPFWNDLAAARLTSAVRNHDPEDFRQAIIAADRAIALDPACHSADFNRGLACEYLGQNAEAVRSYSRSSAASRSGWSDEARARVAFLRR